MPKAITPAAQLRIDIFNEMTEPLQKEAQKLRAHETSHAQDSIASRYDMGASLQKISENPEKYGADCLKQLAVFLGYPDTMFYNLVGMCKKFTREEAMELAGKETNNGLHISPMHLIYLSQLPTVAVRKKITDRVFAENLSANELLAEVRALTVDRTGKAAAGRGVGRKPGRPTSIIGGVQQVFSNVQSLYNRFEGWEESLFTPLHDIAPDDVDESLIEKLEQALDVTKKLEKQLPSRVVKMTKALESAKKSVAAREAATAEATA